MSSEKLHIVSFDIPYPPDYGGAIDVFYKLKALSEEGVKIVLHCFEYGRSRPSELEQICDRVYFYKRNYSKRLLVQNKPFIVISRSDSALLDNLLKDEAPILFEGFHTTFFINHPKLSARKKFVRAHNIEHEYYKALARNERKLGKRFYLKAEAGKLEKYESDLKNADLILAISPHDTNYYSDRFKFVKYLPAFHAHKDCEFHDQRKPYALYHGNLSVNENMRAAEYLVSEVFQNSDIELKIVGNGASNSLKKLIAEIPNIELIEKVNNEKIDHFIREAQLNILVTFQQTGIKLKLLNALFLGGHCLVNQPMVESTGLESLCVIDNSPENLAEEAARLMKVNFTKADFEKRKQVLGNSFSNDLHARQLKQWIFNSE